MVEGKPMTTQARNPNQNHSDNTRRPRADTTMGAARATTEGGTAAESSAPPPAPPAPPQIAPTIRCPECRAQDVRHNGKQGDVRYYRCNFCVDPTSQTWTTFKVLVTDPLAPTTKVTPEEAEKATEPDRKKEEAAAREAREAKRIAYFRSIGKTPPRRGSAGRN